INAESYQDVAANADSHSVELMLRANSYPRAFGWINKVVSGLVRFNQVSDWRLHIHRRVLLGS
ncbi:hypothetical protein MK292_06310, partial [Myxococcota bacterium]|nr:hypothetical protein [Myxococcota bacterium]